LSDNTCPLKIVVPANPLVPLLPSPNTANFKRIEFYIRNPVLLRLLVCKEENKTQTPINCLYPDHKNSNAVNIVCNSPNKLAHIYLRHEKMDNVARSCVIFFIDTIYLFTPNGLLKLFTDTVNWLNIAHERPYFYVILRYNEQKTIANTEYNRKIINFELRKIYDGYSKDEDICIIIPANKQAELLRIDHTNGSKKFYIKPQ